MIDGYSGRSSANLSKAFAGYPLRQVQRMGFGCYCCWEPEAVLRPRLPDRSPATTELKPPSTLTPVLPL
jgi:hypothetical protein